MGELIQGHACVPGSPELVLTTVLWCLMEMEFLADSEPTQWFRTASLISTNDWMCLSKAASNQPRYSPTPGSQVEKQNGEGLDHSLPAPPSLSIPAHFPLPHFPTTHTSSKIYQEEGKAIWTPTASMSVSHNRMFSPYPALWDWVSFLLIL